MIGAGDEFLAFQEQTISGVAVANDGLIRPIHRAIHGQVFEERMRFDELLAAEPGAADGERAVVFDLRIFLDQIHPGVGAIEDQERRALVMNAIDQLLGIGRIDFGDCP